MQTTARPSDWWQTTTFDELRDAAAVVDRFQVRLAEMTSADDSAGTPTGARDAPDHVARAILLQRFMSNDATLERLLERADSAIDVVNAALRSGQDPRDDSATVDSQRSLELLEPVLFHCGQMLDSRSQDKVGPATRSTAETVGRLLFDYSLVPLSFGILRRRIHDSPG